MSRLNWSFPPPNSLFPQWLCHRNWKHKYSNCSSQNPGVILHSSFSLTLHIWSTNKSFWLSIFKICPESKHSPLLLLLLSFSSHHHLSLLHYYNSLNGPPDPTLPLSPMLQPRSILNIALGVTQNVSQSKSLLCLIPLQASHLSCNKSQSSSKDLHGLSASSSLFYLPNFMPYSLPLNSFCSIRSDSLQYISQTCQVCSCLRAFALAVPSSV